MNPKDEVKEKLSILDVVSTYVRLEKAGGQYRARCPFHNERSPSFYVSPERKSFHCFGCGEHGDIFTFVEKTENIPFYEALKLLADRAGVKLIPNKDSQKESRLLSVLKDATEHFESNFLASAQAQEYIGNRGVLPETRALFHIGFAKDEWRDCFITLSQKGYSPEEIELAGLAIKTEKGFYDRFRGRVMFPIRNIAGATVGFSGRILPALLDATKEQAKYVNTPETPMYHKSKILFGYDTAKKMMNEKKNVVVVEGQMDLVMSYQAGVHNTIAVSGTAFTDDHINLIKRFGDKVILSFDTDNAGQNALKKSALMCLYGGLDVYVTAGVGTKDPADLIKDDASTWIRIVDHPVHIIEFLLGGIIKSSQDAREQGKRVVTELLPYVRAIPSSVDRVFFLKKIAVATGITEEALNDEIKRGAQPEAMVKEEVTTVPAVPLIKKLERELIALSSWLKIKDKEEIKSLNLPFDEYPDSIIEETIFELEKTLGGDKDKHLKDVILRYKKEVKDEKINKLKLRIRQEPDKEESILKEIMAITKGL
jgi:DNA primase